jgi:hypothetical protein
LGFVADLTERFTTSAGDEHGGKVRLVEDSADGRDGTLDVVRSAINQFADLDPAVRLVRARELRQARMAAGGLAGGAHPYRVTGEGSRTRRRCVEDADEMAVVGRVVELRGVGASYREICHVLTAEGYRPRRAATGSPMVVRAISKRGRIHASGEGVDRREGVHWTSLNGST